jgi:hypothetical protein
MPKTESGEPTTATDSSNVLTSSDLEAIRASDLHIDTDNEDDEDLDSDGRADADEDFDKPDGTESEGEGSEEDGDDEDGDDDLDEDLDEDLDSDEPDRLKLDPKVKAALPKEIAKRFEEQAKGLEKVQKQLAQNIKTFNDYVSWDNALANKATAADALKTLATHVAQQHGLDLVEVLGLKATTPAAAKTETKASEALDGIEFKYDTDKELAEQLNSRFEKMLGTAVAQAKEDAKREALESLGVDPKDLKGLLDQNRSAAQERAFAEHIKAITPTVQATFKAKRQGFEVTEGMVREALEALPQFKDRPAKAVDMYFSQRITKHMLKAVNPKKGPESPKTGGIRGGVTLPKNPLEVTASDIMATMK